MDNDPQARMERACQMLALACAVRALMASHPVPSALREAWDQQVAALWANHSLVMAGKENPMRERLMALTAAYERLIPK